MTNMKMTHPTAATVERVEAGAGLARASTSPTILPRQQGAVKGFLTSWATAKVPPSRSDT